ncbi:uncharacterized protein LOC121728012 [Aricia agestis]|uniref:uncharacterized protein LOC121728012 n=1 Tax=Aricia agestis TaxID=91739 RepID=UPI001C205EB2|nr:uncharacterized protein LOC121728012 [Aricia agestis]
MGRRRRDVGNDAVCTSKCGHGAHCVAVAGGGGACACAGPWGGAACNHYVGHEHPCSAACESPAICVWKPTDNPLEPGTPYCACPVGGACAVESAGAAEVGAGAWGAGLVALLALLAALLGLMCIVHRRRRNAFGHARLSDNVEINNPMYLAGEDEPETRQNGGNHFANPVYESMYAPQQTNPVEEHATLLEENAGEAPPERAALL